MIELSSSVELNTMEVIKMEVLSLWPLVGLPVIRSVAGWLENALEDGKIEAFEWTQLGSTVLRLGIIGFATFFGLNGLGFDVNVLGAAGSAFILDFILRAIKKKE